MHLRGDCILVYFTAAVTALWFGILVSVCPCTLGVNIAAVTFISKNLTSARDILLSGLAYTVGRMITYTIAGIIVIGGILSIPGISNFTQKYMNYVLGPILIFVGLLLLDIISLHFHGPTATERFREQSVNMGIPGAGVLGLVLALSFCPFTAFWFFGSLVPLAIANNSPILFPLLFGFGTALPVVLLAFVIAFSAKKAGQIFFRLQTFEIHARKITGYIFILTGIYFITSVIFGFHIDLFPFKFHTLAHTIDSTGQ